MVMSSRPLYKQDSAIKTEHYRSEFRYGKKNRQKKVGQFILEILKESKSGRKIYFKCIHMEEAAREHLARLQTDCSILKSFLLAK